MKSILISIACILVFTACKNKFEEPAAHVSLLKSEIKIGMPFENLTELLVYWELCEKAKGVYDEIDKTHSRVLPMTDFRKEGYAYFLEHNSIFKRSIEKTQTIDDEYQEITQIKDFPKEYLDVATEFFNFHKRYINIATNLPAKSIDLADSIRALKKAFGDAESSLLQVNLSHKIYPK